MMHRPEREFYRATVREIMHRWEIYAECKGYKESVQEVVDVVED